MHAVCMLTVNEPSITIAFFGLLASAAYLVSKRVMERRGRQNGDHNGAGEGPDTALATLAAEPPKCGRGGQMLWPDTVYGTAASRRRRRARTSVSAAKTNSQSRG